MFYKYFSIPDRPTSQYLLLLNFLCIRLKRWMHKQRIYTWIVHDCKYKLNYLLLRELGEFELPYSDRYESNKNRSNARQGFVEFTWNGNMITIIGESRNDITISEWEAETRVASLSPLTDEVFIVDGRHLHHDML